MASARGAAIAVGPACWSAGSPLQIKPGASLVWFGAFLSFPAAGPARPLSWTGKCGEKNDAQIGWAAAGRALRRAEHAHRVADCPCPSKQTTSTPRASCLEANSRRDRWHGQNERPTRAEERCRACAPVPVPVAVNPGGTKQRLGDNISLQGYFGRDLFGKKEKGRSKVLVWFAVHARVWIVAAKAHHSLEVAALRPCRALCFSPCSALCSHPAMDLSD